MVGNAEDASYCHITICCPCVEYGAHVRMLFMSFVTSSCTVCATLSFSCLFMINHELCIGFDILISALDQTIKIPSWTLQLYLNLMSNYRTLLHS